jgi:hypothetical protein
MNRTKYILRGVLLLTIVLLLINLYKKTDNNLARIAKFKLDTFNKIKTDSLDKTQKFDTLFNETTKFNKQLNEDSPQISVAVRYLFGAVGLLIAAEFVFFVTRRRRPEE